jgi:hypothetical protein
MQSEMVFMGDNKFGTWLTDGINPWNLVDPMVLTHRVQMDL